MFAKEWKVWLLSKVLVGLGNGLTQTVLIIYNSEIAPPPIRGFLLAAWQLTFGIGGLVASLGLQLLIKV